VKIEGLLPKENKIGMSRGKTGKEERKSAGGIITVVKLGIKEKRQEKGQKEGCMEKKWWKIMTRYSKEIKTTRRGVEDAIKENREECVLMGGCFNGRIGERGAGN
jgi:hypothetical protein